jgi:putative tricarboxylic transport membrane protein
MASHQSRYVAGAVAVAAALAFTAPSAKAQTWRPQKPVELIVSTGAGGIADRNARFIQKIMQDHKLVPTPMVVVNKPGGNQLLALNYLKHHGADPHFLLYANPTVFTNQIAGLSASGHTDMTPLALLMTDYTVISVRSDSPIKSIRDMISTLKADPQSISFGLPSRGGPNHLAAAQAMRSAGIDPNKLKLVLFKTNAEAATAVMGGHINATISSVGAATLAGNMRMLAVAAPKRIASLPSLPTMREEGINATGLPNWRGVFGPKGMTAAQIAFWEEALAQMVKISEWEKQLDENNLDSLFLRSREFAKFLDSEFMTARAIMADLGLAKNP